MTEETAIRIAEALESIDGGIRTGIYLMMFVAAAFWMIAMFKK